MGGDLERIRTLIASGADVNAQDDFGILAKPLDAEKT